MYTILFLPSVISLNHRTFYCNGLPLQPPRSRRPMNATARKTAKQLIVNQRCSLINTWTPTIASVDDNARRDAMIPIKLFNTIPRKQACHLHQKIANKIIRLTPEACQKTEELCVGTETRGWEPD